MSESAPGSRVGTRFGHYQLKRLLGRGGMGEVYEAHDTVKDRVVALKLMSHEFSQDPVFRKRMQREAHTAGRLQEPHVVPIHDFGEIEGQLYLDMRLIEGTDLDTLLQRFGPLDPPRAVAIIRQIAAALDAAHADGVMHRDVKPQNILITRDDFAYLVDFGIASATTDEKLTQLGTAVGTWKYMAPERFSNDDVTYRADIYALACVLHECVTGAPPYRADSVSILITAHMMQPIPKPSEERPGIPQALDGVIARGMAKNPNERYASAGDLALAAHEALSAAHQDQAATMLERSQQSAPPAAGPTLTLPAPTLTGQPTWSGGSGSSTPPPQPWSQGSGSNTPPPQSPWNQAPAPPPPSPWKQAPAPPPQPPWNQPTAPPPPSPWNQAPVPPPQPPWNQPPAKGSSVGKWILVVAAVVAIIVVIAVVAVIALWPKKKPLPTLTADQIDSLLLSDGEVNTIMDATSMQTKGDPGLHPSTQSSTLTNQSCLGALYAGQELTYEDSDYDKLHYRVVQEPTQSFTHLVVEAVALFKSADKARAFVESQAAQWQNCTNQNVTATFSDQTTDNWHLGKVDGAPPKITLTQTEPGSDWKCQRALSAVSNVVFDVDACSDGVSDQGSQIVDKMAAKVAN